MIKMMPVIASAILGTKKVKSDSPLNQETINRIVTSTKFTPLGFDSEKYKTWAEVPNRKDSFQQAGHPGTRKSSKAENIYKDPELKHHHHLIVKENIYASIEVQDRNEELSNPGAENCSKSNHKGKDNSSSTVVKVPNDVSRGFSCGHLVLNIILYILGLILFFLTVLFYFLSLVYRQFVVKPCLQCWYGSSRVKLIRRSADTLWGNEGRSSSSNIVFIMKVRGSPDYEQIVDDFERKVLKFRTLERANDNEDGIYEMYVPYEKLKWIVKQKLLFYCWEKDKSFNVRNHFFLERVMDDGNNVDDRIQALCEAYLEHRLDPMKPQWEFRIIAPMGGSSPDYGLIFCVHHSYGDGFSWLQMLRHCLADEPVALTIDPLRTLPRYSLTNSEKEQQQIQQQLEMPRFFNRLKCTLSLPHHFASSTVQFLKERNVFHGPCVKGSKICQWTTENENMPVEGIKSIRHKSGKPVVFTAVILSCVTKAFQRCFINTNSAVPFDILAAVPYAQLPYKTMEPTNNFSMATLPLPTRFLRNRQRRLKMNDQTGRKVGSKGYAQVSEMITDLIGSLIVPLVKINSSLLSSRSTVAVSNLPGPKDTLSFFGGQEVTNLILFPPPSGNRTGVSIGILSYCGKLNVSISVDATINKKHPKFSHIFLHYFEDEIQEFLRLSSTQNEEPLYNQLDSVVEDPKKRKEDEAFEVEFDANSNNLSSHLVQT